MKSDSENDPKPGARKTSAKKVANTRETEASPKATVEQLTTRLQYFMFERSLPKSQQKKGFAACPRCRAKWLLHGEMLHRQQHGKEPLSTTDVVDRAKEALFPTEEAMAAYGNECSPSSKRPAVGPPATPPRAKGAAQEESQKGTFEELKELMGWRQAGLLTLKEFEAAKRRFFGGEEE